MKSISLTLAIAASLLTAIPVDGKIIPQTGLDGAKIYNDYSIPLPEGKTLADMKITKDDLQLTDKYLDLYPEGVIDADRNTLQALYEYYKNDPSGQKEWESIQDRALKAIPAWDIHKLINKRYIYSVSRLTPLAMLYIFTGNEAVSDFVRGHLSKMASLPIDFWIHAELHKLFPEKPQGYIETSYMNQAFPILLQAVRRNMSEEEYRTVTEAWYEKGYKSGQNWLEAHVVPQGNFTAVIANGVLCAAKYFKDEAVMNEAIRHLKMYMDMCILPDGSNFEGYSYFDYPARQLFNACLVMTPEQIKGAFADCSLKSVSRWRISGMLLGKDEDGLPGQFHIIYGDNPSKVQRWRSSDITTWLCTYICEDNLSAWIAKHFEQKKSASLLKLQCKLGGKDIGPKSPEELGLPLMSTFQSGDCYIRSGWGDDDVILGLKQITGDKEKQLYYHSRPEINSINLGAYGDYIICNAASASYRSPIRQEHDVRTWRANVIAVDGKDQFFPDNAFKKTGCYGFPTAQIVRKETLPDGGCILSNEAKDAYATPMKQATRTIKYVPQGRFYIVKDIMIPEDGEKHRFDHRLFIFNHDGKTSITKAGQMMHITRPRSELYIALQSSSKLNLEYRDAYIHGLGGRDYDPDGPNQGKLGSAIGLQWSCDAPNLEVTTILYPKHPGERAPKIKFSKGKVTVDGIEYKLNEL